MAQEVLPGTSVDPSIFRQEIERLRRVEVEQASLQSREAKLQTALAEKSLENLELRWRVAAAREATHPSLAQVIPPTSHQLAATQLTCTRDLWQRILALINLCIFNVCKPLHICAG